MWSGIMRLPLPGFPTSGLGLLVHAAEAMSPCSSAWAPSEGVHALVPGPGPGAQWTLSLRVPPPGLTEERGGVLRGAGGLEEGGEGERG